MLFTAEVLDRQTAASANAVGLPATIAVGIKNGMNVESAIR
jgi:hypothetical protein